MVNEHVLSQATNKKIVKADAYVAGLCFTIFSPSFSF